MLDARCRLGDRGNLGTSENTAGFSECVVSRINSVKWECAAAGKHIRLDLRRRALGRRHR